MIYDMEKQAETDEIPVGLFGQMSFQRLERLFRETGEIGAHERVTHFEIKGSWIRFRVDT